MRLNLHRLLMPFAGIFLLTLVLITKANAQQTPIVTTDQADYPPGATAIITGSGFQAGETVTLQVLHVGDGDNDVSGAHAPWDITADASGNIAAIWIVPLDEDELGATLLLTADGKSSGLHAEWTFTDAAAKITGINISPTQSTSVTYGSITSVTYNITLTPSNDNSAGSTTLSLGGTVLPSGATVNFSTNPVVLPANSNATIPITLTITNATNTPAGVIPGITVRATSSPNQTSNTFSYVVNQKTLNITPPSVASKVYDGSSTSGAVTVGILSGFAAAETVTATAIGTYPDANVGNSKIATVVYTLANGTNGGLGSNYSLANGTATGNITTKLLTAASTVASKTYDAATTPGAVTLGTVTGLVGSQTLVITPSASNYTDANVGTGKSTAISYTLANGTNGGLAANYSMADLASAGVITVKPLTATSTVASKVYDATTAAGAVTLGTVIGLVGSQTLVITPSAGNYTDANVGAGKSLTISYSLVDGTNGGLASNYSMANLSATGAITAKPITATSAVAPKIYDGTTTAGTVTVGAISGLIGSQTLNITATGSNYSDANVGTGKSTTISYLLANGTNGGLAANYSIAALTSSGDITAKLLTAASAVASKAYDGTATAGAVTVGAITGLVGTQTLNITATADNYSNANVGTGKATTISYSLANGANGGLATNYSMANLSATGTITKKALTVTAPTVASKVYDGSATSGAVTAGTLSGLAGSETLIVTATGQFATADIGSKLATITYNLADGTNGGLASNYSLANSTATGTITAKPLTISSVIANNKVYDGTTTATLNNTSAALVGIVTGDNVMLNVGTTASFADKNVANGKAVTASGYSLGGGDKNNYTLSQPTGLSANITIRSVTGSVTVSNKVYDGNTSATILTRTLSGVQGSDVVSYIGGTATFANANAGIGKTVTATGLSLDGADAANYTVNSTATTTANITKATATLDWVAGTLSQIYDGSVKTVVATTTPSGLSVNYSFTGTPQNVGTYPVTATINDINYQGSLDGTLEIISPATATDVTSSLNPSVYGQSVTFTATVTSLGGIPTIATVTFYDGANFIGSSSSNASGIATLSTSALTAGTHNITASYAGAGIYLSSTSGILSQIVNKANATVTVTGYTGVYNATAHGATGSAAGVSGDPSATGSSLDLGASFTDAPGGTAHWIFTGGINYNDQSGNVLIVINKADAVVSVSGYSGVYDAAAHGATGSATGVAGDPSATGSSLDLGASFTDAPGGTAHWIFTGGVNYNDQNGDVNIEINKAPTTTIVTINGGPFTYNGSAQTPATVTVTGAGSLSLTPTADYSNNTNAGIATASYTYAGDDNHTGSSDTKNFTIGKASSTTTVTINGGPFTYNGSAQTPATVIVTGAGGLNTTPDADYLNNINAGTATGSYTYAGDANHDGSSDSKNFTITKADPIVNVTHYSVTYDGHPHTATYTITGVNGETDATVGTIDVSATTHTNAGTYNGDAWSFTGAANYNDASGSVNDAIAKANPTIVVTPYSVTYDGHAHTATYTINGVNGETDATVGTITVTGTTHTNAGTYNGDVWSFTGAANYNDASGTVNDKIDPAIATVTADNKTKTYGDANPTLTATVVGEVSGGDAINYTLSTTASEFSNVGPYPITITLGSNPNYNVSATNGTLTVTQKAASIVANDKSKTYGDDNPSLDATVTGTVNGDVLNYTLATTAVKFSGVGPYPITVTSGSNPNYNVSITNGTLTVTQKAASIIANNKSKTYGDDNPSLDATVTGTVNGDLLNYILATTAVKFSSVGDYPITVTLGSNPNYAVTPTNGMLHINKRNITITADAKFKCLNSPDPTLTAQATNVVNGDMPTGSLTRVAGETAGTYAINKGTYTYGSNYYETYTPNVYLTVYSAITATVVNKNPHLYYGYSGDQADTIVVTPSGGTGPYTVSVTMNRNMICNYINDAGDEAWKASGGTGGTTTNNVCGSITGHPVSTATISAGGSYTIYATLLDSAVYTVTVTDIHMCNTYTKSDSIWSEDVRCFAGNSSVHKVQLCHQTGSAKNPCVSICVDSSAVAEHLAHGDAMGPCPKNGCGTSYNNSATAIAQTLNSQNLKVSIMPNPSVSGIDFRLTTSGANNQEIQIRVLNMVGTQVYSTRGSANETYRFGANFLSGIYLVEIIQNNSVQTLKIIKQ
jgi:hypothetical protein